MGPRLRFRRIILPALLPNALYVDAVDALIRWQLASRPDVLPAYDDALLSRGS